MPSQVQTLTGFGIAFLILSFLVVNIGVISTNGTQGLSFFGIFPSPAVTLSQLSISDGILFMAIASFIFDAIIYRKEK